MSKAVVALSIQPATYQAAFWSCQVLQILFFVCDLCEFFLKCKFLESFAPTEPIASMEGNKSFQ